MYEKKIKPITPSQRHTILLNKQNFKKIKPIHENEKNLQFEMKKLINGFNRANGRNHTGKITVRSKGGGHKRLYRQVTFNRSTGVYGYVKKFYTILIDQQI